MPTSRPPTTTSRSKEQSLAGREIRATARRAGSAPRRPVPGAASRASSASRTSTRSTTRTSTSSGATCGAREDPLAPHQRSVPPPPAAGRRRGEAGPRDRPPAVRRGQVGSLAMEVILKQTSTGRGSAARWSTLPAGTRATTCCRAPADCRGRQGQLPAHRPSAAGCRFRSSGRLRVDRRDRHADATRRGVSPAVAGCGHAGVVRLTLELHLRGQETRRGPTLSGNPRARHRSICVRRAQQRQILDEGLHWAAWE